ncbi:unnamed protein product, partial [Mesorhabditis spiculigera]
MCAYLKYRGFRNARLAGKDVKDAAEDDEFGTTKMRKRHSWEDFDWRRRAMEATIGAGKWTNVFKSAHSNEMRMLLDLKIAQAREDRATLEPKGTLQKCSSQRRIMPGQPLMPMLTGALHKKTKARTAEELLGSPILMTDVDTVKGEEMAVEKTQRKEAAKKPSPGNISAMSVNEPEVEKKLIDENAPAKGFNVNPDEKTFANLNFTPPSWGEAEKKKLLLDISLSPIVGNAKMSQRDEEHPNQPAVMEPLGDDEDLPEQFGGLELNRSMSEADFVDWIDNDDS